MPSTMPDPQLLHAVAIAFVFVFGACIGSFLNVVIWRMPRGLSVVYPPSHCPKCANLIAWYDNLPIISWLALRGRCRKCKTAISPRYLIFELLTALMLSGLYAAYFIFKVRRMSVGAGDWISAADLSFSQGWVMFIAHSALLCCLLACSMIDAKFFMIPLSVMWTAAVFGFVACVADPHPMLAAPCSPVTVAAALAAAVGLIFSIFAQYRGWIVPSFIDAGGESFHDTGGGEAGDGLEGGCGLQGGEKQSKTRGSVGFTSDDGVNPRREMLKELLFLAPAIVLAVAAAAFLKNSPAALNWWSSLFDAQLHPAMAGRLACGGGSLVGYLMGGLWIWATRIIATLIFGREAMGLGDVHILAGVGAVTGWVVPAIAFFLAPVFGLTLAVYMMVTRRGRELPYGPWLALGSLAAMLFYDAVVRFLGPGISAVFGGA